MPATSRAERLARLERILLSADRYVDALLEVRSSKDEVLFRVGGLWDRTAARYVTLADRAPVAHVFRLKESQDEIGRAMGRYIEARRRGDDARPLYIAGVGDRGGGKTAALGGVFTVALALEFPGTFQASVNITTKQRREVLEALDLVAPPRWIRANVSDFRDPRTEFVTNSTILWFSSKNPTALRQAGLPFEHVFINEGQDQSVKIFDNALFAVRKLGAIVTIATNGSQGEAGDWIPILLQAIEAGLLPGEAYVLPGGGNDAIHQPTRDKTAATLRIVDRAAYEADALGLVTKLSGNPGYPGFSSLPRERGGHVGEPPAIGWVDITREVTAEIVEDVAGVPYVAGADFQATPGSCAAVGKLYRNELGQVVLWIRELVAVGGVEAALSQALVTRGYTPKNVLLVGDATGARQNAEHSKRESNSFIQLRNDGWMVIPPMKHWNTGVDWNPLVKDSRDQMHSLFLARQLLISARCDEAQPGRDERNGFPSLIEGFQRAKVTPAGSFVRKGHLTHGPDAVRYLAWRFLPRAAPLPGEPLDDKTFEAIRKVRLLTSG